MRLVSSAAGCRSYGACGYVTVSAIRYVVPIGRGRMCGGTYRSARSARRLSKRLRGRAGSVCLADCSTISAPVGPTSPYWRLLTGTAKGPGSPAGNAMSAVRSAAAVGPVAKATAPRAPHALGRTCPAVGRAAPAGESGGVPSLAAQSSNTAVAVTAIIKGRFMAFTLLYIRAHNGRRKAIYRPAQRAPSQASTQADAHKSVLASQLRVVVVLSAAMDCETNPHSLALRKRAPDAVQPVLRPGTSMRAFNLQECFCVGGIWVLHPSVAQPRYGNSMRSRSRVPSMRGLAKSSP